MKLPWHKTQEIAGSPTAPAVPEEDRIDVPTVAERVQVAHYFRGAMEQRRSIGLRAFFTVTGFDLLITKGVLDYHQLQTSLALTLVRVGIAIGFVLYVFLVVSIERANWHGEESYLAVEADLRRRLLLPGPRNGRRGRKSGWQAMRSSWSGLWPAVAALAVAIACVAFLSTL